ncbi:MAG: ATP-binding cassette domain-containing protein [Treponema sp.]|jgi:ABC-2 type transport system ATP-binding protein|nr:ATP-binding cassette domain-containing protein [Treponema sp.]
MIEVESLSKKYGTFEAVRDVSFSVGREQVLGFLGPNGAGKTTIMKILTGYHFPSRGTVKIDGISVEESPLEIKAKIGYLPESNPLYGDLTPEEYLNFMASVRLISGEERQKSLDNAIAACGLEEVRNQRIDSLSKGYKQRVGLAQAIIHDPPILILDEPTSGLDPNQIIEIRSLIRELGKRKTVILSTHILQEVEAVCSRVLILNEGRIAAQGTPEEIAGTMKGASKGLDTWELYLKGAEAADIEGRLAGLDRETGEISTETVEDGIIRIGFVVRNGETYSLDGELIFDWAVSQGYKIIGMSRKKLSLEDIFVKLTSEQLTAEQQTNETAATADREKGV